MLILAFLGVFLFGLLLGIACGVYGTIKACEWDDKACPRHFFSR